MITVKELRTIKQAMAKAGWEYVAAIIDDTRTGGLLFTKWDDTTKTSQRFLWNETNTAECKALCGLQN